MSSEEKKTSASTPDVYCGNCGLKLEEDASAPIESHLPCPSCGSMTRAVYMTVSDVVTCKEKRKTKARRLGKGKPSIEQVQGDDLHRDTGTWRTLSRVIDRENDEYHEIVKNPETGKILHECHEPLSQHCDHGAAKKGRKAKDGE